MAGREGGARRGHGRAALVLDCAYTLEQMRERGLEHVVTQHDLGGFFDHVFYVHPLLGADEQERGATPTGPARTSALSAQHTVIEIPIGRLARLRRLAPLNLALAQCLLFVRLSRLLRQRLIRVIVVADPFYLGLLGLVLSRVHRVPVVVRVNSNYDTIYASTGLPTYPRLLRWRRLENLIARVVLNRADLVTVGSEDNLRYVITAGAKPPRVTMIPTGDMIAPVHLKPPEERPGVPDELGFGSRPFVAFVGRLEPSKLPESALQVLVALQRAHPKAGLLMVGDGSRRAELELQAQELGIGPDVRFVGIRNQEWVSRALRSATVVLCPYSGLALVEGALSGTPIVGYEVEWHAEFVTSGDTGILVPYGDVERLAEAVVALFDDPERAEKIGRAARERALREMDRDDAAAVKRAAYATVCESGPA